MEYTSRKPKTVEVSIFPSFTISFLRAFPLYLLLAPSFPIFYRVYYFSSNSSVILNIIKESSSVVIFVSLVTDKYIFAQE